MADERGNPEPGGGESSEHLADQVDDALQALWDGETGRLDELVESEESLQTPGVSEVVGEMMRRVDEDAREAAVPKRIGDYAIKRVLGRGGMGTVYLAVQEQPRRAVALKVMKGGITSRSALRRFEYESQILARLRHPNIAQVYEAGTHKERGDEDLPGVPYFAMEYIPNARPITEFVKSKNLATRQRLELFAKVCDAIHHGHQKGIIHRDLKPGNILVDSNGEPKIIDFGVARATDSDMVITTLQTDIGQLIGTLQYMSPEQCEADPHDLDVRSDVYALGVILYELLCGQLPYDVASAAVFEAARIIREEQPARPSTINRTLRGDIETIILKAMEKERERRYGSAASLGDDIRRHLNDEPIEARPSSTMYLLRKKLSKHVDLIVMASAVCMIACGVIIVMMWSAWREDAQERMRAFVQARREALYLQIATDMQEYRLADANFLRRLAPDVPESSLVYLQCCFQYSLHSGKFGLLSEVIQQARQELDTGPNPEARRELLAEMLRRIGEPSAAEALQAGAPRRVAESAEDWYVRSFSTLDHDTAAARSLAAVNLIDDDTSFDNQFVFLARAAYLHRRVEDPAIALGLADRLIGMGDGVVGWWKYKTTVLVERGDAVGAIAGLNAAIELDPSTTDFLRDRALLRFRVRDYRNAREDLTTVIDDAADPVWGRYYRGTAAWILGDLDTAIADYCSVRKQLTGPPSYADARLALILRDRADRFTAEGYTDEAQRDQAESNALLAGCLEHSSLDPWLRAIIECLAGRRAPEALVELGDESDPSQMCEAYYYAGEAALLRNRPDDARRWFAACAALELWFDPDASHFVPMNEYHLACWRLESLTAGDERLKNLLKSEESRQTPGASEADPGEEGAGGRD